MGVCLGVFLGKARGVIISPDGFCSGGERNYLPRLRAGGQRQNSPAKALTNSFSLLTLRRRAETSLGLDETDNAVQAFALPEIGHDERPFATHPSGVSVHFFQRCADMRREVDLVDDEKVRPG